MQPNIFPPKVFLVKSKIIFVTIATGLFCGFALLNIVLPCMYRIS